MAHEKEPVVTGGFHRRFIRNPFEGAPCGLDDPGGTGSWERRMNRAALFRTMAVLCLVLALLLIPWANSMRAAPPATFRTATSTSVTV
ncbi:MAG: hypothetical protein ACREC5_05455, partial [Thermoplasmata archaeon]